MTLSQALPRRLRSFSASTLVVTVAVALVGTAFGLGAMGQAPSVFDGSAWLWSRPVGEVARVNGNSGNVDLRQPLVDSRGHRIRVEQDDNFLLLHDLETGRVTSVDLARMGFSGSLSLDPANDVAVLLSGESAMVVDRTRGLVRPLDPATLQARGEPLQLPAPLVGGAYDASGALWLGLPGQGTVVAVTPNGAGLAVSRTVPVATPGHDLALSVLDSGVLAIDRSGDTMVAVTGDQARELKAPTKLTGAVVPERTVGRLAVVTVPAERTAVVIRDVTAGGPTGTLRLPADVRTAVPFAGRVYVPDDRAGLVRIYTVDGDEVKPPVTVPRSSGPLELLVREQYLFINGVDAPTATVVDSQGRTSVVDKFGPGAAVPDPTASAGPPSTPAPPAPTQTRPRPTPDNRPPASRPGPPGVPVPVTALAGDGQVRLTWGRAATTGGAGVDRHVITWNGGRTTVDGGQLSTVVTGLRNGTTFRFRVVAENRYGTSPPALSGPVTPVGAAPPTPGAPTATVVAGRVTVSWTAVEGGRDYVVRPLRDGRAGSDPPQTVTGLSAEFEGLTPGATYTFTVVARSADGGASPPSRPSNEVVPFTRPGAPRNLAARQVDTDDYRVTWEAAAPNGSPVQRYVVRDGNGAQLGEVAGGTRSLSVRRTAALTEVTVHAVNAAGEGPAATARVTPLPQLTVRIRDVLEGDDDVIVLIDVTNPGGGTVTCETTVGGSSARGCDRVEVTGLTPETTYTVEVTATSGGRSDTASRRVETYPRGTSANIHCHDSPDNADPDFCTANGGVPIFASPGWRPGSAVGHNADDYPIFVICRVTSDMVDGTPYGGQRSAQWIFKAGGHYVPYAFVNLHNGTIDAITRCRN